MTDLPNLTGAARIPSAAHLCAPRATHPPRVLLLYGALRARSFSRLLTLEAERLLRRFGCETRVFDPTGLPLPDAADPGHDKAAELREASLWSEGQVWTSPERHGAMTGVMKIRLDWIPLALGAVRPTQGRTLAVMQVSGGSRSFNAVNQMRLLGRWMRMLTIPNQSSVAKAYLEFGRPDAPVALLRPGGGRDGGAGEVHPADPRDRPPSDRPLQRAKGNRGPWRRG